MALLTVPEAAAVAGCARPVRRCDRGRPARVRRGPAGRRWPTACWTWCSARARTDLPAVQAQLTLVAPVATMVGGDQPGEIGGQPVSRRDGARPRPRPGPAARRHRRPDAPAGRRAAPGRRPARATARDDGGGRRTVVGRGRGARAPRRVGWRGAPPQEELERLWAEEAAWTVTGPTTQAAVETEMLRPSALSGEPGHSGDRSGRGGRGRTGPSRGQPDAAGVPAPAGRARSAVDFAVMAERPTRTTGISRRPRGSRRRPTRSRPWRSPPDQRARSRTCWTAPAVEDWSTGRGSRSPTRSPAPCSPSPTPATSGARQRPGRPGGLGPPGPCSTYRPGAALDRFLRARDRRCRFPGCRNRVPRGGELDHNEPWPDGPTEAGNLTGFCTGHHRGKHQAPGWRYDLSADGTLTVTTPTGLTASTEPPPF